MDDNENLIIHPFLTPSDARRIIKSLFGVGVLNIELLSSYGDQNFYVKLSLQETSKLTPDENTIKITSEVSSKIASEGTSEIVFDDTSEIVFEDTSESASEYTSKVSAEDTTDIASSNTQKLVQNDTSKMISVETSNLASDNTSQAHQQMGNEFVLKVINSEDSMQNDMIETRVKLMLFSKEHGINCPVPVRNVNGVFVSQEKVYRHGEHGEDDGIDRQGNSKQDCGIFKIVLLTYLPGICLSRLPEPLPSSLLFEIGKFSAKLTKTLLEFEPIPPSFKSHTMNYNWNLRNCFQARAYIGEIPRENVTLVTKILNRFERHVIPKMGHLRAGIIHSDICADNLIVSKNITSCGPIYQLEGIIDFGDASYSRIVFDVSIALASIMLCESNDDPIHVAGHFLAGYQSVCRLQDTELQSLYFCILARLAQLQLIRIHDINTRPRNPHIERGIPQTWKLMEKLWNTKQSDIEATWSQIALSYSASVLRK